MYGRGRGKKAGGRRGRGSHCGRYWMEGGNGFGQNPQGVSKAPFASNSAAPVAYPPPPGIFPQQQFNAASMMPPGVITMPSNPMQHQALSQGQWCAQPWQPAGQWPANQQWSTQNLPSQQLNGQQHSFQQHSFQQQGTGHGNQGHGTTGGGGKGPAVNAFPGPGSRAYFTKEYMDILEEIKMDKALDEAKKKIATSRRSGVKIVELPTESSHGENRVSNESEKSDKSDEMKAWVTATLGDSLKLIREKLEGVDNRSKISSSEKEELERLRVISAAAEKKSMDSSSSEKRKRVLEVKTDNPPVFPHAWKLQIENSVVEIKVSTKTAPICFRCRERGHMGTYPNCLKFPKQTKEHKLLANMMVEVGDAPSIWFIADSNYNGWVFYDNLEEPDWVWHYADQELIVKKPNIFPPADSRWQKKATGKMTGNPSKIRTDPLIDSRVIREEKDREDLLRDLDIVRDQEVQEFNKEPATVRILLQNMEQTALHKKKGGQTDNKRSLENGGHKENQEGGLKKRRATKIGDSKTSINAPAGKEGKDKTSEERGTESEQGTEGSNSKKGNSKNDSEGELGQSLQWLRDYVDKVKREREHAFDVRVAWSKHAEKLQTSGKKGLLGAWGPSSNQFHALRKAKAEELSEYTAFRYAEKKRAKEQGVKDKDKTVPESKDEFQDLRPKKWKSGKNQKKKVPDTMPAEFQDDSGRTLLEQEAVAVMAQTDKLKKLNEEYAPEFTTISHIAKKQAPLVVETARSSRLTLMNIRPLIVARYLDKVNEWQVATDVSFQISCFEEGQNVADILREKVTTDFPLGVYDTVSDEMAQQDTQSQTEQEDPASHRTKQARHPPQAFSPLIVKLSTTASLKTGMRWRPWRTITAVPYSVLAGPCLPAELTAVSIVQLVTSGVVLQQDDGNGYRPVEFMSARMPSEKVATSTYERELYALRQALDHWKHYLLERHFKVYSDHETLRWLKTQAKMTPKFTRWAAKIDQFDFELNPVKGKYNDREDLANVLKVGLEGGAKDEDVIKVHDDTDFEEVT
ncbi:hypothetical protein CBR_g32107 [Chara braunii]|uniref:Reverse transcriptase RNase H-like domain-containing protein n=1 Tax=Chara braunii TaxID=69332 RepID=A0A388LGH6_CHABU|nr:hypothetical protein CBR_g32107 [Chara braunii]|eukprot:GBG81430.1 hypothetical protein CBR_g32107 [Chara braunii]